MSVPTSVEPDNFTFPTPTTAGHSFYTPRCSVWIHTGCVQAPHDMRVIRVLPAVKTHPQYLTHRAMQTAELIKIAVFEKEGLKRFPCGRTVRGLTQVLVQVNISCHNTWLCDSVLVMDSFGSAHFLTSNSISKHSLLVFFHDATVTWHWQAHFVGLSNTTTGTAKHSTYLAMPVISNRLGSSSAVWRWSVHPLVTFLWM